MLLRLTVHSSRNTLFYSAIIPGVSVAIFTPIKVHDLGFSAGTAQLLSVPPFLFGGIFTYIVSVWSDRVNLRGPFIVAGALVSIIGYIIAYTTSTPGPGYAAAIIASCGTYPSIAISLAWAGGNAGGDMKRGTVLAIVSALGNLGGYAISSQIQKSRKLMGSACHPAASVLHLSTTNHRVFTRATAQ